MGETTHRSSRASITDLPELIIVEILLHLSIKGIVMCKCVCKTWHHLISSPYFAKHHFSRSKVGILVRPSDIFGRISSMLYFIKPSINDVIESGQQANMKLGTKLNIPLHNNTKNHKIIMVNSCNGFLCLSDCLHNNPTIVCNLVTNEYIELPAASNADESTLTCGFEFCQQTNQYKVLRVLSPEENQRAKSPIEGTTSYLYRVVEIHTLGTKSWRNIGFAPSFQCIMSPTYLNGVLHWIAEGCSGKDLVPSFEFSSECFESLPLPPISRPNRVCMGTTGDNLCLIATSGVDLTDIWVMESCGVQRS